MKSLASSASSFASDLALASVFVTSGFTFFVFTMYDLLSLGVADNVTGATVVVIFGWATVVVTAVVAGVAVVVGLSVVAGAAVDAGCCTDVIGAGVAGVFIGVTFASLVGVEEGQSSLSV